MNTPLSDNNYLEDQIVWGGSENGIFSLKSTYGLLVPQEDSNPNTQLWKSIWKLPVLPKINFFLWEMGHKALLTRMELNARVPRIPCKFIFPFILWHIWLARNDKVFTPNGNGFININTIIAKAAECFAIAPNPVPRQQRNTVLNKWNAPPAGWVKLNSDGAYSSRTGKSGAGAVIRNHDGGWMVGSFRSLRQVKGEEVELWALRDGLILAKHLCVSKLIVEVDALNVVNMIKSNSLSNAILSVLILDCRTLLESFDEREIKHVYREANKCADGLARVDFDNTMDVFSPSYFNIQTPNSYGWFICINPPNCIAPLVAADKEGSVVT